MSKALLLVAGCLLALGSCTQRLICPAYESAFMYDKDVLRKRFSYFNEDSTPKILTVSKNKYLIIPEQSYRKKIRSMQTIEMKPIYPHVPDSLLVKKEDEFAGAEQDVSDSLGVRKKAPVDSVYAISKDKEVRLLIYDNDSLKYHIENVRFNADQENYMWYFRDVLVLPDVRAAIEGEKNTKASKSIKAKADAKANAKKGKKGFLGFFKNLFKKKSKNDSTSLTPVDSIAQPTDSISMTMPKEKKAGLFNLKKKGSKAEKKGVQTRKDPAKKEDGF